MRGRQGAAAKKRHDGVLVSGNRKPIINVVVAAVFEDEVNAIGQPLEYFFAIADRGSSVERSANEQGGRLHVCRCAKSRSQIRIAPGLAYGWEGQVK